jgi:hypothetical protein
MKECSFKPVREAKKFESKYHQMNNQFESVYKFSVDSVLKKYTSTATTNVVNGLNTQNIHGPSLSQSQ